jgi:hypothetical protein
MVCSPWFVWGIGWLGSSRRWVEVRIAWAASSLLGGVLRAWFVGVVFFMDCESGSGASLGA